jgi:hypothetical protein
MVNAKRAIVNTYIGHREQAMSWQGVCSGGQHVREVNSSTSNLVKLDIAALQAAYAGTAK